MRARRRVAGAVLALALLSVSCDADAPSPPSPPPTATAVTPSPSSPSPRATLSAEQAAARLCRRPEAPEPAGEPGAGGPVPEAIARSVDQVEEVRGLEFVEPVQAEPVTHQELVSRLEAYLDYSYPAEMLGRRSRAWQTIGVIPEGASIREALVAYSSSQIIGFYDPASDELVFIGTEDPSPGERLTLAHELTHALDDQHFDLERLNDLEAACRDEELLAAIGAVEGSAQLFAFRFAGRFLTAEERAEIGAGAGVPPAIPPFIRELQLWPYFTGFRFMSALAASGGLEAVNAALERLPDSTEQVIHPERYPEDRPQAVDVPDLAPALGQGWRDLDVLTVGEEWLAAALRLRLADADAESAAAGWDGGRYRAWTDGEHVAVVLSTVWDSEEEAGEFAAALEDWRSPGQQVAFPSRTGARVDVLFASDGPTLEALRRAFG